MTTEATDIPMTPVESAALSRVGYDQNSGTLRLEFKSGAVYDYDDVPPEVHEKLLAAESLGRHFQGAIRPNYNARLVA